MPRSRPRTGREQLSEQRLGRTHWVDAARHHLIQVVDRVVCQLFCCCLVMDRIIHARRWLSKAQSTFPSGLHVHTREEGVRGVLYVMMTDFSKSPTCEIVQVIEEFGENIFSNNMEASIVGPRKAWRRFLFFGLRARFEEFPSLETFQNCGKKRRVHHAPISQYAAGILTYDDGPPNAV